MPQFYATDGPELKNITLPQYPDDAWNWIAGAPKKTNDELYACVAAVFRVANMQAEAVGNMPFALLTESGAEYDTSDDWQNKVGFLPNPRALFRLWRLSLFMTSSAYGFMEGNQVIQNLRYIVPSTIEPIVDDWQGLVGFRRRINNQVMEYTDMDKMPIRWIWRLDHTTELLPTENSEFKALMAAAGALFYADHYVQHFFKRGGIKPTMLMVKGVPNREEREKIEGLWDKIITQGYKFLGKIFSAETIEPVIIGEGIDNLRDSKLHSEKLADVAMAAGMPLSLLVASSANYATADIEYRVWFRDSVIPWVHFMEDGLNEQLFEPLGLHIKFLPEVTNTGTQEEKERAGAYSALVASNVLPSKAAEILGYDMPEGITYEDLDVDYFLMLEKKAEAGQLKMPEIREPKPPQDQVKPDVAVAESPKSDTTLLTIDQLRELELWQDIAFRKVKRGDPLDFPFVCKVLPESVASAIRAQLPKCADTDDIERVFQMSARDEDPIKELAEALNLAASKLEV